MKSRMTKSNKELSSIGIGTYGIGGRGHRDVEIKDTRDESTYVPALVKQFKMGYNFSEISLGYGHGNAAKYFAKAIKESGMDREDLFLTNAIYPRDIIDFKVLEDDIDEMYKIFATDYFDSTLVTQSLVIKFGYERVVKKLWDLLNTGKTRYVSLSNSNKNIIEQFKEEFKDKLFAHETHISFEIRECQDEGIFELSDSLGVKLLFGGL